MSTVVQGENPILYKTPEVLTPAIHGHLGVNADKRTYLFSKDAAYAPLNASEFEMASKHYPIVFLGKDQMFAVAVLGLQDRNVYVDSAGDWAADTYVPEYLRRYPFIFGEDENSPQLALCVDTSDAEVVAENADQPFFDGEEPTPITQQALKFCKVFQEQNMATQHFVEFLKKHDLVVGRQADYGDADGERKPIAEFFGIDEEKLDALPVEPFEEIRRRGYLRPICAHLSSLVNFARVHRRTLSAT